MIAVLGGLGAATLWATATLCSSRSSRMIGAASVLAWVMLVGLAITLPAVLLSGVPEGLDAHAVEWLVLAGTGNVVGLLLEYRALRTGKVGIVTSIASTEGAIAAVLAVILGERLAPGTGAMLAAITAGVFLAGFARNPEGEGGERRNSRAALLAVGAAVAFGAGLYATGRVSNSLPVVWALLPARAVGVAAVAIPLAITSRIRLTRRAAPLVVVSGVCEVAGFLSFALGARHGIAVAAVLGSQFAAISAVVAYLLFRERLARVQLAGIVVIVAGVAVLSAIRA